MPTTQPDEGSHWSGGPRGRHWKHQRNTITDWPGWGGSGLRLLCRDRWLIPGYGTCKDEGGEFGGDWDRRWLSKTSPSEMAGLPLHQWHKEPDKEGDGEIGEEDTGGDRHCGRRRKSLPGTIKAVFHEGAFGRPPIGPLLWFVREVEMGPRDWGGIRCMDHPVLRKRDWWRGCWGNVAWTGDGSYRSMCQLHIKSEEAEVVLELKWSWRPPKLPKGGRGGLWQIGVWRRGGTPSVGLGWGLGLASRWDEQRSQTAHIHQSHPTPTTSTWSSRHKAVWWNHIEAVAGGSDEIPPVHLPATIFDEEGRWRWDPGCLGQWAWSFDGIQKRIYQSAFQEEGRGRWARGSARGSEDGGTWQLVPLSGDGGAPGFVAMESKNQNGAFDNAEDFGRMACRACQAQASRGRSRGRRIWKWVSGWRNRGWRAGFITFPEDEKAWVDSPLRGFYKPREGERDESPIGSSFLEEDGVPRFGCEAGPGNLLQARCSPKNVYRPQSLVLECGSLLSVQRRRPHQCFGVAQHFACAWMEESSCGLSQLQIPAPVRLPGMSISVDKRKIIQPKDQSTTSPYCCPVLGLGPVAPVGLGRKQVKSCWWTIKEIWAES